MINGYEYRGCRIDILTNSSTGRIRACVYKTPDDLLFNFEVDTPPTSEAEALDWAMAMTDGAVDQGLVHASCV